MPTTLITCTPLTLHATRRSNIGIGGGSLAFQGTVAEEIAFFASLGAPLPPFANPAEHALTCLDAEYGVLGLPTLWRLRRLHLLYQARAGALLVPCAC